MARSKLWPCVHTGHDDPKSTICIAGWCSRCGHKEHEPRNWKRARKNRSEKLRAEIARRDGNECWLCLEAFMVGDEITIDHENPRSRGGSNHISNLRRVHASCNQLKANKLGVGRGAYTKQMVG